MEKETSGCRDGGQNCEKTAWKWWVSVNRHSVAASPIALPAYPTVMPTPQLLIGFDTQEEQVKCFRFLLHGRPDRVQRYTNKVLLRLSKEGKVLFKVFRHAEKPCGETIWLIGREGAA
jgi:hypothetical protein